MNLKKYIFLVTLITSINCFSQSWIDKSARIAVERLEKKLAPYEELHLSDEVREQIFEYYKEYHLKRWELINEMKENGTYNEFTEWKVTKPLHTATHQKIKKVLTESQLNAGFRGIK